MRCNTYYACYSFIIHCTDQEYLFYLDRSGLAEMGAVTPRSGVEGASDYNIETGMNIVDMLWQSLAGFSQH